MSDTNTTQPSPPLKQVRVDKTGRIYYDSNSRPNIETLSPVLGMMTVPTSDRTALHYMEDVVNAALAMGEELPEDAVFVSGQVFYTDIEATELEEVRVKFTHDGATWVASPTEIEPRVDYQDGQVLWSREDESRSHISAVLSGNELHVLFNLATVDLSQFISPSEADSYNVLTSQEFGVLVRSACDGKRWKNWKTDRRLRKHIYEIPGDSHRVEMEPPAVDEIEEEEQLQKRLETWGSLIKEQDADFTFALFYICSVLAPPTPLRANVTAIEWIDLDDVAAKIGYNPSKRSLAEREAMRERIWNFIQYGDRATVKGERTIPYEDKATKEVLATRLDSAVWRIMDKQRPEQTEMFVETPRRVQLVIGKQWEPLLTNSNLAQYLPLGEILGGIPAKQVAGDWARLVGLVLAGIWRRKPRETQAGTLHPTRRELLTAYTPKTKTVNELLSSNDPRRAVEYWRDALGKLLELNVIARTGEPTRTVADMMKPFAKQYGWQEKWLNEKVEIVPGSQFMPHVEERAKALPKLEPKTLPNAKRRGRPRKKVESTI